MVASLKYTASDSLRIRRGNGIARKSITEILVGVFGILIVIFFSDGCHREQLYSIIEVGCSSVFESGDDSKRRRNVKAEAKNKPRIHQLIIGLDYQASLFGHLPQARDGVITPGNTPIAGVDNRSNLIVNLRFYCSRFPKYWFCKSERQRGLGWGVVRLNNASLNAMIAEIERDNLSPCSGECLINCLLIIKMPNGALRCGSETERQKLSNRRTVIKYFQGGEHLKSDNIKLQLTGRMHAWQLVDVCNYYHQGRNGFAELQRSVEAQLKIPTGSINISVDENFTTQVACNIKGYLSAAYHGRIGPRIALRLKSGAIKENPFSEKEYVVAGGPIQPMVLRVEPALPMIFKPIDVSHFGFGTDIKLFIAEHCDRGAFWACRAYSWLIEQSRGSDRQLLLRLAGTLRIRNMAGAMVEKINKYSDTDDIGYILYALARIDTEETRGVLLDIIRRGGRLAEYSAFLMMEHSEVRNQIPALKRYYDNRRRVAKNSGVDLGKALENDYLAAKSSTGSVWKYILKVFKLINATDGNQGSYESKVLGHWMERLLSICVQDISCASSLRDKNPRELKGDIGKIFEAYWRFARYKKEEALRR